MGVFEIESDSIGEYVADVVQAAATLAERAVESADRLAAQAVRDAGKVAAAFEDLTLAALRSTVDFAREIAEAARTADDAGGERRAQP